MATVPGYAAPKVAPRLPSRQKKRVKLVVTLFTISVPGYGPAFSSGFPAAVYVWIGLLPRIKLVVLAFDEAGPSKRRAAPAIQMGPANRTRRLWCIARAT